MIDRQRHRHSFTATPRALAPGAWRAPPHVVLTRARLLIVDDEAANLAILRRMLQRAGITQLVETTDPLQALPLFVDTLPDLVCLDLHMPELDGFGVLERLIPAIPDGSFVPIVMLTGDPSQVVKRRALALGARDFVAKPFDSDEVLLRIRNLLELRFAHLELRQQNQMLEVKVLARTLALDQTRMEVLDRLARAAEFRDDATGQHTRRVGRTAVRLAANVGVASAEVDLIARAAPLHDLGKIGIPDVVLLKPATLTTSEFNLMKAHTTIGAEILSGGRSPLIRLASEIALDHHERWDGSGYPAGLAGESSPLAARIVGIADYFDAMTHDRPYREALPLELVLQDLESEAGRRFDPCLVQGFLQLPHRELM
jgi:putative two-component system response regulator